MNYTHLFDIQWDDSYNDPDFSIPGTFLEWIEKNQHERERLAKHLEWMADSIRNDYVPFGHKHRELRTDNDQTTNPPQP